VKKLYSVNHASYQAHIIKRNNTSYSRCLKRHLRALQNQIIPLVTYVSNTEWPLVTVAHHSIKASNINLVQKWHYGKNFSGVWIWGTTSGSWGASAHLPQCRSVRVSILSLEFPVVYVIH